MNKFLLIFLALFCTSTFAAPVYKCKNASGKVIYQNQQCPQQAQMEEVEILAVDPSITENAQNKLQQELDEQSKIETEKATQSFKNRQLNAFETNNSLGDGVQERTQQNTNYLQNYSPRARDKSVTNAPIGQ